MSVYTIKEAFLTLQGEGHHVGRRAVFVRFAGCNGWSGREVDRDKGPLPCSSWCDTDFVGINGTNGGRYEAAALVRKCAELWGNDRDHRFVVLTGGEPMLQVDQVLINAFHRFEFEIAVETNGTKEVPLAIDWVTVSPKSLDLIQDHGQELKLVYPQVGIDPEYFDTLSFRHFFLQPMDGPNVEENTKLAVAYCLEHPQWRLSLQTHKFLRIP